MPIFNGAQSYYVPEILIPVVMIGTIDLQPVVLQYIPKPHRLNSEGKFVREDLFNYTTTISKKTRDLLESVTDPLDGYANVELIYEYRDANSSTVVMMGMCQIVLEDCKPLLLQISPHDYISKARVYPPF